MYGEKPERIMTLPQKIYQALQEEKKPFHLTNIELVTLRQERRDCTHPSFVYIAVGLSPRFFSTNCDTVDDRYEVDELGLKVLRAGLKENARPIWAWSNYNFCQVDFNNSTNLYTSSASAAESYLKPVLEKLSEENNFLKKR